MNSNNCFENQMLSVWAKPPYLIRMFSVFISLFSYTITLFERNTHWRVSDFFFNFILVSLPKEITNGYSLGRVKLMSSRNVLFGLTWMPKERTSILHVRETDSRCVAGPTLLLQKKKTLQKNTKLSSLTLCSMYRAKELEYFLEDPVQQQQV